MAWNASRFTPPLLAHAVNVSYSSSRAICANCRTAQNPGEVATFKARFSRLSLGRPVPLGETSTACRCGEQLPHNANPLTLSLDNPYR